MHWVAVPKTLEGGCSPCGRRGLQPRGVGARDEEDGEDEDEEAEDVVEALQPDGGHDEVELDEDGAEGQDAADEHGEEQVEVPRLGE